MSVYNNGTKMPSPQEASNGFPQPSASGTWHKPEEEVRLVESGLVKKAHREILDHERKRRVELKCMELQEMMEEQGYSEEDIRQKVGTFRQMLMEKEGVLTREDQHGRHIVIENHHMVDGEEYAIQYAEYEEGCPLQCDCAADCYQYDSSHQEYRLKRQSSSSTSPPPKKKKKKKSGHRRNRKKRKPGSERSGGSSSPVRKEKKKKSGKKHRRDRSGSGSHKKRRHRSRSPKNKRKEKNKDRKRSHSELSPRRSHRHSSYSSRSLSLSSEYSDCKSTSRLSPKYREDGQRASSHRSSHSPSSSCTGHSRSATPHQNGHKGSAQNGRHSHGALLEKKQERLGSLSPSAKGHIKTETLSLHAKESRGNKHGAKTPRRSTSPGRCSGGDKPSHRRHTRSTSKHKRKGHRRAKTSASKESSWSVSHTGYSSDSEGSTYSHQYHATTGAEKNHRVHLKTVKERHHRGRPHSCSPTSAKHSRHNSERKRSLSRSSSWSSSRSPSKSRSRSREKRAGRSRTRSGSQKKITSSREKENEPRTRHSDTEPTRARRRSRSYSPIRKRRRDSPSFMEPRRITRVLLHLHVPTSGEVYLAADGKNGTFSCPLRLEDWMKKGLHFSHILKIAPWEISLSPCFSDNLSKG
ncbi:serine/arginine repetitive matrix protein 3 isoform X1 [Pantherophis guttatus]|uniref:Serine/arginine repetitive matrix protein 3 isoform X1 n=1 Tax=Pantherophis guttatus TaxID=94885 RepID=A0ABM3ZLA1_PANGU|nr:serine/arginine repetitive matrix protein 3 isoform X1 [Pantherophis guttatus]XP_060549146.1 serine/arginine repetitive matrix protein 3 isoform X1 [Pantherophis guttatus]